MRGRQSSSCPSKLEFDGQFGMKSFASNTFSRQLDAGCVSKNLKLPAKIKIWILFEHPVSFLCRIHSCYQHADAQWYFSKRTFLWHSTSMALITTSLRLAPQISLNRFRRQCVGFLSFSYALATHITFGMYSQGLDRWKKVKSQNTWIRRNVERHPTADNSLSCT